MILSAIIENRETPMTTQDPQVLAENAGKAMFERDRASQSIGMRLDAIAPGSATLSMTVTEAMINGLATCHGGFIFSLADSACAFASNSHNQVMVLQSSTVTYLNAARLGDHLTAVGETAAARGRTAIIDVTVTNQDATPVALFRGIVRSVGGTVVPEDGTQA